MYIHIIKNILLRKYYILILIYYVKFTQYSYSLTILLYSTIYLHKICIFIDIYSHVDILRILPYFVQFFQIVITTNLMKKIF